MGKSELFNISIFKNPEKYKCVVQFENKNIFKAAQITEVGTDYFVIDSEKVIVANSIQSIYLDDWKKTSDLKIKLHKDTEKIFRGSEEMRKQEADDRRRERESFDAREVRRKQEAAAEEFRRKQYAAAEEIRNKQESADGKITAQYKRLVATKIRSNTLFSQSVDIYGNPQVEIIIELEPDGSLRDTKINRSSGIVAFDQAVKRAIEQSAPFPPDSNGKVPQKIIISHRIRD